MNNILSRSSAHKRKKLSCANDWNLSQRTIKANEELERKYRYLDVHRKVSFNQSMDGVRKKRNRTIMRDRDDSEDTSQMLRSAITDLEKTKFTLKSIVDDGKTTLQLAKFSDHDIYVISNLTIYYSLDLSEFKDKIYLAVKYFDNFDLQMYVSKSSPRPTKVK